MKKNSGAKIRTAWLRIPPLLFSAEHGPLSASGILFLLENWGRTLFSHIRGGGVGCHPHPELICPGLATGDPRRDRQGPLLRAVTHPATFRQLSSIPAGVLSLHRGPLAEGPFGPTLSFVPCAALVTHPNFSTRSREYDPLPHFASFSSSRSGLSLSLVSWNSCFRLREDTHSLCTAVNSSTRALTGRP